MREGVWEFGQEVFQGHVIIYPCTELVHSENFDSWILVSGVNRLSLRYLVKIKWALDSVAD